MIAIVDYGMGNLHSVRYALERLGETPCVTGRPEELRSADRIVLPGVGAFGECVKNLRAAGLLEVLYEEVVTRGKPFFGICLGMQVLASTGHEMGVWPGLGWIAGEVRLLEVEASGLKVPHVGWNEVLPRLETPLFRRFRKNPTFYFTHSYHLAPSDPRVVAAQCEYGMTFTAAVLQDNMFATQFHPEKSQDNGLRLLDNFLTWKP
jgi:imidazole glycerol-phosphate synthase subunit HisH